MKVIQHLRPLAATVLVLGILSGCITITFDEPTAEPGSENGLAGTHWRLVSFGPPGADTPVVEGSTVTLSFEADGQAGGSGGCNSYGSEYRVQDGGLSFGQITSTLMACADERLTEQEQQYFQALQSAGQFELEGDTLVISYDGGQGALYFVRASSSAPAGSS